MVDPTYDPITQTVADDRECRVGLFDLDYCPKCGGYLVYAIGGDGPDMVMCWNALGSGATCDVIVERPADRGAAGGS